MAGVACRLNGWAFDGSGTARVAVGDGRAAGVAEAGVGQQVRSAAAARHRKGGAAATAKPRPLAILSPTLGTRHDEMIDPGGALRFLNPKLVRPIRYYPGRSLAIDARKKTSDEMSAETIR